MQSGLVQREPSVMGSTPNSFRHTICLAFRMSLNVFSPLSQQSGLVPRGISPLAVYGLAGGGGA